MQLSEFNYTISSDLIAQFPLEIRDASRLLVMYRNYGTLEHRVFRDITDYLKAGDVLVLNNAKVLPLRLYGKKPSGGRAEITLLKELDKNLWEGLVKGLQEGRILLGSGIIAEVSRSNESVRIQFDLSPATSEVAGDDIKNLLQNIGVMPLPIYTKPKASICRLMSRFQRMCWHSSNQLIIVKASRNLQPVSIKHTSLSAKP